MEYTLGFVWIDTICIDKTNNTELSEAIKRMYEWYQDSKICFAYLIDVKLFSVTCYELSRSRWFTRGWTLQELLAPQLMLFLDCEWDSIGFRDELAPVISEITGIGEVYLSGRHNTQALLQEASIAERMSWASRRNTTREEDKAYCLLGIFGVNIPLLYGEGMQAFQRLQMEIALHRFDPTLLAWEYAPKLPEAVTSDLSLMADDMPSYVPWLSTLIALFGAKHPWYMSKSADMDPEISPVFSVPSLLAPSPESFRACKSLDFIPVNKTWSVSANRLQVTIPKSLDKTPYIVIPCYARDRPHKLLTVPLTRQPYNAYGSSYGRAQRRLAFVHPDTWHLWPHESINLDLSSRRVASSEERVPYILYTQSFPEELRCTRLMVNAKWQPFSPTIKIRASQVVYGNVDVCLFLEHKTTKDASALCIKIMPPLLWHTDLLPGIRHLVQSWLPLARVKSRYLSRISPSSLATAVSSSSAVEVLFSTLGSESENSTRVSYGKLLESTTVDIRLECSPALLAIFVAKAQALALMPSVHRLALVCMSIGERLWELTGPKLVVSFINAATVELTFSSIFRLVREVFGPRVEPFFSAMNETLARDSPKDILWRTAGFHLFQRCLVSALYLCPRLSGFAQRHFWLSNLLWFIGSMFFSQSFKLTFHSPLTLQLAALGGHIVSHIMIEANLNFYNSGGVNWLMPVLYAEMRRVQHSREHYGAHTSP